MVNCSVFQLLSPQKRGVHGAGEHSKEQEEGLILSVLWEASGAQHLIPVQPFQGMEGPRWVPVPCSVLGDCFQAGRRCTNPGVQHSQPPVPQVSGTISCTLWSLSTSVFHGQDHTLQLACMEGRRNPPLWDMLLRTTTAKIRVTEMSILNWNHQEPCSRWKPLPILPASARSGREPQGT